MDLYLKSMAASRPTPRLTDLAARQVVDLFDALPDVQFFVKDRRSRFVKVNEAFLAMHGCAAPAELVGKTDYDFHPPALAAQYVAEDRQVMRSGRPLRDRAWLVGDHAGVPQWYLCTKLPLHDAKGEVCGVAEIGRAHV